MNKQQCYQFLNELESIIQKYHERNGTYNFHYHGFQIEQWHVGLPKYIYEKIDVDDFVINVLWADNSNGIDSYYITFDDLFEWYQTNNKTGV